MPAFSFATSATVDDELGIWQPLAVAVPREFSVAPDVPGSGFAPPPEEVSVWQVALPEDRRAASAVLAAANSRLTIARAALPYAAQRLAVFNATGGVPVPVPRGSEAPEEALAEWVAAGHTRRELPADSGRIAQVTGFFAKVRDSLRSYAAIDTTIAGQRAGLTLVSWTGDFRTAWPRGLSADAAGSWGFAAAHTAAVALTLRTRDAWLRLGLTVAQGALQVATLFSANPALALPAVYRFVRQVIEQVQVLGNLSEPGQAPALT